MKPDIETRNQGATNHLAFVALILSAGVLLLGPFGSIPGIILGRRALNEFRGVGVGVEQGQVMAKAAIRVGWIGLGLFLLACVVSIVWLFLLQQRLEEMHEELIRSYR